MGATPNDWFTVMFSIISDGVKLEIEIVPVQSLIQHEKTIGGISRRLTMEFANLAYLRHPVIIEKNNIVLDGNHRVAVFNHLGFRYIPACRIDYYHPMVKLRYWFRVLKNVGDATIVASMVSDLGGRIVPLTTKKNLFEALIQNDFSWGIQQQNRFYCVRFSSRLVNDAVRSYQVLEKLQEELTNNEISLDYLPCSTILSEDEDDPFASQDVVLWTPQIGKEMIIEAARCGQVFAPKTTRHLIPARPLNINVPGHWLNENITLNRINRRLFEHLSAKRIREFGPGQVIEGRYYGEKLFIFYD